jgi:hypothetical protein
MFIPLLFFGVCSSLHTVVNNYRATLRTGDIDEGSIPSNIDKVKIVPLMFQYLKKFKNSIDFSVNINIRPHLSANHDFLVLTDLHPKDSLCSGAKGKSLFILFSFLIKLVKIN